MWGELRRILASYCRVQARAQQSLVRSWAVGVVCLASGCASGETPPEPRGGYVGTETGSSSSSSGGQGGTAGAGGAPVAPICTVSQGLDAAPRCDERIPSADGLDLVTKWQYDAVPLHDSDLASFRGQPLVANLDDDNGDGVVDLCDTPDVLIQEVHFNSALRDATDDVSLLALSGTDGGVLAVINPGDLSVAVPAIADLDRDGVPEILATNRAGYAIALHLGGEQLWQSSVQVFDPVGWYAIDPPAENYLRAIFVAESAFAVHDLDGDGTPEILVGMTVLDAAGQLLFQDATQGAEFGIMINGRTQVRPTAADLDGDGALEVLFGHVTYTAAGEEVWRVPSITPGYAHPADFDGNGDTEVLITSEEGLTLVSATGEVLWGPETMGTTPPRYWCWSNPAALADLDGDGLPEALVNTCEQRMVLAIDATGPLLMRSEPVPITTEFGAPTHGSTAFDFLGGGNDWIAHHHQELKVFAGMQAPPISEVARTFLEGFYPVVADVDNDGSADIVTVEKSEWRIVVYEDRLGRPSPARRIWHQWNYVAGQIREDATVPVPVPVPAPAYRAFRAQPRVLCAGETPPR